MGSRASLSLPPSPLSPPSLSLSPPPRPAASGRYMQDEMLGWLPGPRPVHGPLRWKALCPGAAIRVMPLRRVEDAWTRGVDAAHLPHAFAATLMARSWGPCAPLRTLCASVCPSSPLERMAAHTPRARCVTA